MSDAAQYEMEISNARRELEKAQDRLRQEQIKGNNTASDENQVKIWQRKVDEAIGRKNSNYYRGD